MAQQVIREVSVVRIVPACVRLGEGDEGRSRGRRKRRGRARQRVCDVGRQAGGREGEEGGR